VGRFAPPTANVMWRDARADLEPFGFVVERDDLVVERDDLVAENAGARGALDHRVPCVWRRARRAMANSPVT